MKPLFLLVLMTLLAAALTPRARAQAVPPATAPVPDGAQAAGAAPSLVGDWHGTLRVVVGNGQPDVSLRLLFHITKQADGTLGGTMDSLDQAANGIPLGKVTDVDGTVHLEVPSAHGAFEGKRDRTGMTGTWSQGGPTFPLVLTPVSAPATSSTPADMTPLVGNWEGALNTGMVSLRLAFHFTKRTDGTLGGTVDSLDQGAMDIPISAVTLSGTGVHLEVAKVHGTYDGSLSADSKQIDGHWTQGQGSLPLTIKRVAKITQISRPQTPHPPYPYLSRDVTFPDAKAGVTLAGTITMPKGNGPFPAAVLIAGSGPNNRDEAIFGHEIFHVIADDLTRRGIAVLRYDKRGVGHSTGSYAKATLYDFADDAVAAIAFLKHQPKIDPKRVGVIGHSEGGAIAPMVAERAGGVHFVVLLAGTSVPGDQIIVMQGRLIAKSLGADETQLTRSAAYQKQLMTILKTEPDNAKAKARMIAAAEEMGTTPEEKQAVAKSVAQKSDEMVLPWYRSFISYDPGPSLEKLRVPVLALNGSHDLQVPPDQNFPPMRAALAKAGNHDATLRELPNLNHLFQTSKTGMLSEYSQIEETFAPSALKILGDWVVAHTH